MIRELMVVGVMGGMILSAGVSNAVQVDGYCYLAGQTNHEGIKVLFEADSPGAITDSICTDTSGYYQIDLSMGIYDVYLSHGHFVDEELLDQLFVIDTTLNTVSLSIIPLSGELSGTYDDLIYTVEGDISVQNGDSLIIEAGGVFLFEGQYNFSIYGYLHALGTESDSIMFMPSFPDSTWGGIDFYDLSDDSSILAYCLVVGSNSSGIFCDQSSPRIIYCTIYDNYSEAFGPTGGGGGGIYCHSSSPMISYCSLIGDTTNNNGGGICCHEESDPIISCCYFNVNRANSGGAIYCYSSNPIIDNCIIIGNSSLYGGGIYSRDSNPMITFCTIADNSSGNWGGGIECKGSSAPNIIYCKISDNTATVGGGIYCYDVNPLISYCTINNNTTTLNNKGGGISCWQCSATILNCTISGNLASLYGGGIYCRESNSVIINTIVEGNNGNGGVYFENSPDTEIIYGDFSHNEGGNFVGDPPSYLGQIVMVNANDDSCDIFYNIFEDPLFVDPVGRDFNLQADSPCIDAGDPTSPLDPDNTIADIGAYYFDQSTWVNETLVSERPSEFVLYPSHPNPFNPKTAISYQLSAVSIVNLSVYDVAGRKVAELVNGWRDAGVHEVTFDGTGLASGVYIYRLTAGDFATSGKMVLMK